VVVNFHRLGSGRAVAGAFREYFVLEAGVGDRYLGTLGVFRQVVFAGLAGFGAFVFLALLHELLDDHVGLSGIHGSFAGSSSFQASG